MNFEDFCAKHCTRKQCEAFDISFYCCDDVWDFQQKRIDDLFKKNDELINEISNFRSEYNKLEKEIEVLKSKLLIYDDIVKIIGGDYNARNISILLKNYQRELEYLRKEFRESYGMF